MKQSAHVMCVVLALSGACFGQADSDEAQATFDSLYGDQWREVRGTKATADDAELAAKLLEVAKSAPSHKGFFILLCDRAYELALADPDSSGLAIEAMEHMAARVPELAPKAKEKVLALRQERYDKSRRNERQQAARTLLPLLLEVAEQKLTDNDLKEAEDLYRKAKLVATAAKSTQIRAAIDDRLDLVDERKQVMRRLGQIKISLESNPDNASALAELLQTYVVVLDDPGSVSSYAALSKDPRMKKLVPAAALDIKQLPEPLLLELGDWYSRLAGSASAAAKPAMFRRADAYYRRFLKLHETDDLPRTKASLALKQLTEKRAEHPDRSPTSIVEWINLLSYMQIVDERRGGTWSRAGGGLKCTQGASYGRVQLSVVPQGEYEIRASFTRHSGTGTVKFILPIGGRQTALLLSGWDGRASGLYSVDPNAEAVQRHKYLRNKSTRTPGALINGRRYDVLIRVARRGGKAAIAVELNGKPFTLWQGAESNMRLLTNYWALMQPNTFGLGAQSPTTFHSVTLRMVSGKAKKLRAPSTSRKAYAQYLPEKKDLDNRYRPALLPTRGDATWKFDGVGVTEPEAATVEAGGKLYISTLQDASAYWVNNSPAGFDAADPARGLTARIKLQVLKHFDGEYGFRFGAYLGDGVNKHKRYLISISRDAVYWYGGGQYTALATNLNNTAAPHTFTLAVRPDGYVQIYRDGKMLGMRRADNSFAANVQTTGPYLRYGAGSSQGVTQTNLLGVDYDLGGPFAPATGP